MGHKKKRLLFDRGAGKNAAKTLVLGVGKKDFFHWGKYSKITGFGDCFLALSGLDWIERGLFF